VRIIESSPILESKTRTGKDKLWQGHVYQDGTRFFTGTSYWQVAKDGTESKRQSSEPYEALPKNVGKGNETSAKDQAVSEFESFVKKQMDKGYSAVGSVKVEGDPLPMLAHKFRDHGHKVVYPVYVQPKLDGMRMLFDGKRGWSRGNKAIIPEVIQHLQIDTGGYIFDGELILPGNGPLQDTMSAAKKFRPGISDKLQYWVYDIVEPNMTYKERMTVLGKIFMGPTTPWNSNNIIWTLTSKADDEAEVLLVHKQFVADGYEGTIIRDPNGKYEIGNRSYSLLKLKDFQDEEFKIIDVIDGGGMMVEMAIFRVETKDGKIFESTPQANHDQRKEMFKDRKKLIGKWATIRFYGKTKDGIPMFNNSVAVRDWEDFN